MGLNNIFTRSYYMSCLLSQTPFQGAVTVSGAVTLTDHLFCNSLLVTAPGVLFTNGFGIFCAGLVTNQGIIHCDAGNGGNATAVIPGAAGENSFPGTLPQGGIGGEGATGNANGNPADSATSFFGRNGGNGGNAAPNTGGSSNVYTKADFIANDFVGYAQLFSPYAIINGLVNNLITGGAGGGGASSNAATNGGGGGAGGNLLYIASNQIINTGIIRAKGGNGGNGFDNGVNPSGGGGAGSGGIILLCTNFLTPGTLTITAGTPGTGYRGGSNGGTGNAGTIIRFNLP
jgi:hypothetical protein